MGNKIKNINANAKAYLYIAKHKGNILHAWLDIIKDKNLSMAKNFRIAKINPEKLTYINLINAYDPRDNHYKLVKELVLSGVEINPLNKANHKSILHYACESNNMDFINFLLDHGVYNKTWDDSGYTALGNMLNSMDDLISHIRYYKSNKRLNELPDNLRSDRHKEYIDNVTYYNDKKQIVLKLLHKIDCSGFSENYGYANKLDLCPLDKDIIDILLDKQKNGIEKSSAKWMGFHSKYHNYKNDKFVVIEKSLLFRLSETVCNLSKSLTPKELKEWLKYSKEHGCSINDTNELGNTAIMDFLIRNRDYDKELKNNHFTIEAFINAFESEGFILTTLGKNDKNIWHALFEKLNTKTIQRVFDELISRDGVNHLINKPNKKGLYPLDILEKYIKGHPADDVALDIQKKVKAVISKQKIKEGLRVSSLSENNQYNKILNNDINKKVYKNKRKIM